MTARSPERPVSQTSIGRVPALALLGILTVLVVSLSVEGRFWWCQCGSFAPWTSDAWGSHTSQHLLDPYSFTHVLHGLVFCGLMVLAFGDRHREWQFVGAVGIEAVWEILENSPIIIERYRTATAALGYTGDTIANSLGDVASCALGFLIARRLGWRWSIVVFVATEIVLLLWIRDSLIVDVITLIHPIEAIKQWQLGA